MIVKSCAYAFAFALNLAALIASGCGGTEPSTPDPSVPTATTPAAAAPQEEEPLPPSVIETQLPESVRDAVLNSFTGDFDQMVELQGGKCALCLRDPGYRLFVDHCHATGKVRGLLCSKCNGALGWFENNRDRIVDYLVWTRESQILELMWATDELVPPEGITSEC